MNELIMMKSRSFVIVDINDDRTRKLEKVLKNVNQQNTSHT